MGTITADRPTEAITALVQERQRYEQWLAVLESRRATTSPSVYTRVRSDYESRLARVLDEIVGRAAELRQLIERLATQVSGLQADEAAKREAQSEAELRSAVGEYTAEQWRQLSQAGEAEIARVMARRAEAAAELAQIQQLLDMAATRRPPPVAAAAVAAAPAPIASPPPPVAPAAPVRPAPSAQSAPRVDRPAERAAFDELAFLHSVVEPKPGENRPVLPKPAAVDAPRAVAAPVPESQAAPALSATQQPPTTQPRAAAPATAPAAAPSPRPTAVASESLSVGGRAAPGGQSDTEVLEDPEVAPVPAFLRDVPLEQVKTLKCAECGTMNFATEWYCERCGGELAAM
jgi:hypothetical protein